MAASHIRGVVEHHIVDLHGTVGLDADCPDSGKSSVGRPATVFLQVTFTGKYRSSGWVMGVRPNLSMAVAPTPRASEPGSRRRPGGPRRCAPRTPRRTAVGRRSGTIRGGPNRARRRQYARLARATCAASPFLMPVCGRSARPKSRRRPWLALTAACAGDTARRVPGAVTGLAASVAGSASRPEPHLAWTGKWGVNAATRSLSLEGSAALRATPLVGGWAAGWVRLWLTHQLNLAQDAGD